MSVELGREALATGQLDEALRIANTLVNAAPASRDAVELKIDVLVARTSRSAAVAAYDTYRARTGRDDVALLLPVARAELRALAEGSAIGAGRDVRLPVAAWERLARHGDQDARRQLQRLAGDLMYTAAGLVVDAALARLGDISAVRRLAEMASSDRIRQKSAVAAAIQAAGAASQAYVLIPLLADPDPETRMAAAEALGALGARDAVPSLRPLLTDQYPAVRNRAALALKRLGDPGGDGQIARLSDSPAEEANLLAAEAQAGGSDRKWVERVRPLLASPDLLVRLRAADLLVRHGIDDPSCRAALRKAAEDPDTGVRGEAARLLELLTPAEVAPLPRLLRDTHPWSRLHAAGAIVQAHGEARDDRRLR